MCIHTPLICYPGDGYELSGAPTKFTAATEPGTQAEFWQALFARSEVGAPSYYRILWSWSVRGNWQAADSPRWTFARYPALFKLYVSRTLTKADEPIESDPMVSFIRVLVPELQKTVFSDP
jgi:hypothetical protein